MKEGLSIMGISAKEFAQLLGVSPATVSLVFNGKPGISPKTRQRILDAAKQYDYTPPDRSQNSDKPLVYLCIYKNDNLVVVDNAFFSELLDGVSLQALRKNIDLRITYIYRDLYLNEQIERIKYSNCVGIILLATEMEMSETPPFDALDIPMVVLDSYFVSKNYNHVLINNRQGAFLATQHLLDMGHTDIGYLASNKTVNNYIERSFGYRIALDLAGRKPGLQIRVAPTMDEAYKNFREYFAVKPALPTAFFACNDIIASACIRALQDSGYRVPDDVSIIGFDNLPMGELLSPQLSTVDVPKLQLGKLAVNRLIEILNEKPQHYQMNSISTQLVTRGSVKRIK